MIRSLSFKGEKVGVFGLGQSGLSSVRSLEAGGASVFAWDDNLVSTTSPEIPLENLYKIDLNSFKSLVVAPGVPFSHPEPHPLIKKAKDANVEIIGDIELFGRARGKLPEHIVVGITGTNGKSTTTELLAHVLKGCNFPTMASGNIGLPVLEQEPLPAGGVYVFELSSFQLDLTTSLNPEYAILLNINPDHLDRHGDMDGYIKAKMRLFDMQDKAGKVILNIDDDISKTLMSDEKPNITPISVKEPVENGFYIESGNIFESLGPNLIDLGKIPENNNLLGEHNWQNMLSVIAVARSLGANAGQVFEAIESYKGLEHRLETVGEKSGVKFINDSKATNSAATSKGLEAFANVYWIAGGEFKEENLEGLNESLDSVKKGYFIGRDADQFLNWASGKIPCVKAGDLDLAVTKAFNDALSEGGGDVLLSPACASYDQFKNYQERGVAFKTLAFKIIERATA